MASEASDDILRDSLEWTLEVGDDVKDVITQVQGYAYNGELVEKITATAKRVGNEIVQTSGEVFSNITGETAPLEKQRLDIRLPLLEGRGGENMVNVESYTRDGQEVRSHERSWPDGETSNNLSAP